MSKANFKKGDLVYAITGDDKGKSGKVLHIDRKKEVALVEGLNLKTKTRRRSQAHPQGAIEQIEGPIHLSNLMAADRYQARHAGTKEA